MRSDFWRTVHTKDNAMKIDLTASPHFSPEYEARARRCPEIQGARETKRAGVLYSTSSPLSERNAVDSGRCAHAAVSW